LKNLPDAAAEELSLRIPDAAQIHGIKAEVADDDEVMREVVCAPLRKWGINIITAGGGSEAMAILQNETGPVLAILDWVMPGMSGLDVCRRIRESGKLAYILLLTARSGKQNIAEGLKAGADDYLTKRISQEELRVRLSLGIRILTLESQLAARTAELAGKAS
jgi:DNA-binding response OmpR family regulator